MRSRPTATPSGDSWGTYRSASGQRIIWAFSSVIALIGMAGLAQPSTADRLSGLGWLVMAGLGVFLCARPRVATGPNGVTTVGVARTRHLSWNDVNHFVLAADGQGYLVPRDGRPIMLSAVAGFRFRPREQERLIAALEEDRARSIREVLN